ncbi:capsular biosynthesis protein [Sphaerotilus sp.]|uniref:capsular biosynthesis protein n=1 Tax=Sphaerotilus sp. TaxID=2093942 RepID=UPI002ACDC86D|nr:capsular biosynthesis protein [Sphaerotilus sp.]MDZ7855363.1 capsular biosynthesis protein [Sphaerotilus sp.]
MKRLFARHWLAWLLVGVPMLVSTAYLTFLSQDRYVSTTVLTVRRATQDTPSFGGLSMLLSGTNGASLEDTRYLREYLHSLGLMRKLDARLQLRTHFESAHTDVLMRLWPGTAQEDMLDYWRDRVQVSLDDSSGLLTLRVQGFAPAFAQQVSQALLAESEAFINDISRRIANEQLTFARTELSRAADQLARDQQTMVAFQARHQMLDPLADVQATGARTSELRQRLTRLEADLHTKQTFLNDDAPDIVTLKAELAAVRQQLGRETSSATMASSTTRGSDAPGQRRTDTLNKLAVEFDGLKTRVALSDGAYRSALASVEATRIESGRKLKSLVVIEPPTLPEVAEFPRRFYNSATLLLVCLVAYTIARLAQATIQEHRD